MSSQSIKFLAREKGARLVATVAARPAIIEPTDVVIRVKAVAINPADCKMVDEGHRGATWPLVPGLDGAGVVEAVGDNVKNIVVGDAVVALFTPGDRAASYQELAVVQEGAVVKVPKTMSLEDAATLGVCYSTATVGLGLGLKTPLPYLKGGLTTGFTPSSVLILGASSALGAATVQLLRLAVPNCRILTTSSPKSFDHLTKTLGADTALNRNSASLVDEVKAATPGSRGVDAIFDAVGAAATQGQIFEAFDKDGPKAYSQVWTGGDEIPVPHGVNSVMFRSRDRPQLEGGQNMMASLQVLLENNDYKVPLPVKKVGTGLDGLGKALDLMRKGVSGEKLVVEL